MARFRKMMPLALLIATTSCDTADPDLIRMTGPVQLMATPEKYDGVMVSFSGFLREFGGNYIVVPYQGGVSALSVADGVLIEFKPSNSNIEKMESCLGTEVLVIGRFGTTEYSLLGVNEPRTIVSYGQGRERKSCIDED